ncbi:COP9 signalosome complex subunit 3 isoform X2 [Hydra vulgaris]|uniref:COP9 signalosome complex subunit 3 n=1 Tax=Hydra vulgaris TaxID=6087 RepID=A0ABM4CFZ0_HYDVU
MEEIVAAIRGFSPDKNWPALKEYFNGSTSALAKNASKIDITMSALDLPENTLGYLYLMVFKVSLSNVGDFELLFDQFQQLVKNGCKEQIQQGLEKFCHLCHVLVKCLIEIKQAIRGILVFSEAILKVQTNSSQMTSLHSDLFQLCLSAKCFKPALKFLDVDVTDINNEDGGFDARSFLLYFYYGGMIFLALKQFEKAMFCLQAVVTTPAIPVSHIMLEAFKKYLLLSLLLNGKICNLPKYTSPVISRSIKPQSSPYTELAEAYSTYDPAHLRAVANKHQSVFHTDKNIGLVKQVMASLVKKRIQKLTKTFLTLSLSNMAARVNLRDASEAEKFLLNMIAEGTIFATIDQDAAMVSFHDNPQDYYSAEFFSKFDSEITNCIHLNERLQIMDRELQTNPQYVQRMLNLAQLDDAGRSDEIVG